MPVIRLLTLTALAALFAVTVAGCGDGGDPEGGRLLVL